MSSNRLSHTAGEDPPMLVIVLSFVCAAIGLTIATIAMAADNSQLLIAGMALGALGPAMVRLAWLGRRNQAGWPNTATTTDRSRPFSDQTPIALLAQSDIIATVRTAAIAPADHRIIG